MNGKNIKVKGVGMYTPDWEKVVQVQKEMNFFSISETMRYLIRWYAKNELDKTAVGGM